MLFLMTLCNVRVAQAVTHSTQENFNQVFQNCVSAINETSDYTDLINNANFDVVVIRKEDCARHQNILEFYWKEMSHGKEAGECALLATIIMQERGLTLGYYMDAVDAYRSNRMNLYEEYIRKMYAYNKSAEQARQEFRTKYGY